MRLPRSLIPLLALLLLTGCLKPREQPTDAPRKNQPAEVLLTAAVLDCLRSKAVVAFEKMLTKSTDGATDWSSLQKRMARLQLRVNPSVVVSEMRGAPEGESNDLRIVALGDTTGGSITIARIVRAAGQPRLQDIEQMPRDEFDPLPVLWKAGD